MSREYKRKKEIRPEGLPDDGLIMGDLDFIAPEDVKRNALAMRKWREVTKIYTEAGLSVVSSTDSGVIGRYCTLYAEYLQLRQQREAVAAFELPDDDVQEILARTDAEYNRERARRLWGIVEYFVNLKGLLEIDRAINAKQKAVLDIEDRIFLNPAAKARKLNIKRQATKTDALADKGFDV